MVATEKKPHVVCIPYPAQSHIKAMLNLAELLNHKGLQITFVNTEFNHKRLLKSCGGLHPLERSNGFQFQTISDGIPRSSEDEEVSNYAVLHALETTFLCPFVDLVNKLSPPPTCIISDGFASCFTIDAAQKTKVQLMLYWTIAACAFMSMYQIPSLVEKGLVPLKDETYLKNGYLETIIDWIPGMDRLRLKDMPSIVQTTDPNEKTLTFTTGATQNIQAASYSIIHTFDALEVNVLNALSSMFPNVFPVGPVPLLLKQIQEPGTSNLSGYSLWKEEPECLEWLHSKEQNSVIYVSFGSSTVMSLQDVMEIGWGLANSNHYFLWIIRSDLVGDTSVVLPPELEEHIREKGFVGSWCAQEKVLNHPAVGGFLTHSGWGSILESLSAGVPMICWTYLWDQPTNCRYVCTEWEVGLEMGKDVKREDVTKLVNELMGKEGNKVRNKAMHWKEQAHIATAINGSSTLNVNKLVQEITMLSANE